MFAQLGTSVKEAAPFLWRSRDGTAWIQPRTEAARTAPKARRSTVLTRFITRLQQPLQEIAELWLLIMFVSPKTHLRHSFLTKTSWALSCPSQEFAASPL